MSGGVAIALVGDFHFNTISSSLGISIMISSTILIPDNAHVHNTTCGWINVQFYTNSVQNAEVQCKSIC